ncbi:MAG: carboxypeptidase-like regulatory domain-containing protein, partial [Acidobacteriota bacterium]|nr:carboxypeptidase-like regulatory domain-containing protein [Acidobacteriota bacterium]
MTHRIRIILIFAFLFASAFASQAQTPQATISGIITDTTGAIVPGATVTAINSSTAQRITTTTNDEGFYVLNALPIGDHMIEAEKEGFKKYVRQGLTLSTAATVPLDIQ